MNTIPVTTPAGFVASEATAFADANGNAINVSVAQPLPVRAVTLAASVVALSGTLSATGQAGPFIPDPGRPIALTLSGLWSGTVTLLRSTDVGAARLPLTVAGQPWGVFTANANEVVAVENEAGATYWLDFARSSGTLSYRIAQ
jgi:hypothetical protein